MNIIWILYVLNLVDYSWHPMFEFSSQAECDKALLEIQSIQGRTHAELKCEKLEQVALQK